jgi:hypothetical protein
MLLNAPPLIDSSLLNQEKEVVEIYISREPEQLV